MLLSSLPVPSLIGGFAIMVAGVMAVSSKLSILRGTCQRFFIASVITSFGLLSEALSPPWFTLPFQQALAALHVAGWISVLYGTPTLSFSLADEHRRFATVLSLSTAGTVAILLTGTLLNLYRTDPPVSTGILAFCHLILPVLGIVKGIELIFVEGLYRRIGGLLLLGGIALLLLYHLSWYVGPFISKAPAPEIWHLKGAICAASATLFASALTHPPQAPGIRSGNRVLSAARFLIIACLTALTLAAVSPELALLPTAVTSILHSPILIVIGGLILLAMGLWIGTRHFKPTTQTHDYSPANYDYRKEWLRSSQTLGGESSKPVTQRVIKVLCQPFGADSGALWLVNETGDFEYFTGNDSLHQAIPARKRLIAGDSDLVVFFAKQSLIINLSEYQADPVRYGLIEIPDAITMSQQAWLIIPLYLHSHLYGIVLINSANRDTALNSKQYDLLKLIAGQACSFLAQSYGQQQHETARQFEALNKASAFLIHDLKTIISQLSLMVGNAPKNRHNPEFIDDMITTTANSVNRMNYLLKQIWKPGLEEQRDLISLNQVLKDLENDHAGTRPEPIFLIHPPLPAMVWGDYERLKSAISHIIQNAVDACTRNDQVTVSLKTSQGSAYLFIQDTGIGMTGNFIKEQLFTPFTSTKGLTGMGIGAYQCREYLRSIGGTISVTSQPGVGSCFTIQIPTSTENSPAPAT